MDLFNNDFCHMEMYDRYVVLTLKENTEFTLEKATLIRQKLTQQYKHTDFVMISNRKYKQQISIDIYKRGQLTNMKGLAIVSNDEDEKNAALLEQKLYGKSFAFFTDLEEAKSWAQNCFS